MKVDLKAYPKLWDLFCIAFKDEKHRCRTNLTGLRSEAAAQVLRGIGINAVCRPLEIFGYVHMTEEDFVWFALKWS